jgi:signal transduction histidine kinase
MGRLHEAAEAASSTYRAAAEVGDAFAQAASLLVQAKVAGGYLRPDSVESTLRDAGADLATRAAALQARSLELRATGRPDEAIAALEESVTLVQRSGALVIYFVGVFPWLATLSREAAERRLSAQLTSVRARERRRAFRPARRAARRSLRYAFFYPNDLPHSLRELAAVTAQSGRYRRAQVMLDWSDRVAARHRAGGELTENARQRLLMSSKRPGRREENAGGPSPLNPFQPPARPTSIALAERFATLLDAGARLISAGSADEIAAAVRETALMLLRADRCEVARIDGGHAEDPEPPTGQPWRRLLVQRAIERQRPVALSGLVADDPDIVDSLVLAGVKSALCAPILGRGEVIGYFLAYHFGLENLFGEDEERLAQFIAHLAGAAFEREVIRQEARVAVVAAQESERARVARDLHDEVGQALTSLLLDVRSLEGAITDRPFDANVLLSRIGQLRKVADDTLGDVQRLAFELRPTILDDLGLVDALQRLAREVTAHNGVTVHLEAGQLGPGRLRPDVETTAYRVVQEALTNAVRHSGASTCSVVATRSEERMRIVVEDDGVGFDPAAISTGHLGLRGMTERAQLVGGTLMISSAAGDGATIVLEVPIV